MSEGTKAFFKALVDDASFKGYNMKMKKNAKMVG